jgi:hypothetical protein
LLALTQTLDWWLIASKLSTLLDQPAAAENRAGGASPSDILKHIDAQVRQWDKLVKERGLKRIEMYGRDPMRLKVISSTCPRNP